MFDGYDPHPAANPLQLAFLATPAPATSTGPDAAQAGTQPDQPLNLDQVKELLAATTPCGYCDGRGHQVIRFLFWELELPCSACDTRGYFFYIDSHQMRQVLVTMTAAIERIERSIGARP